MKKRKKLSLLTHISIAPLLPMYIFEAKMSILLRMAMNPEGAQILFTNRIFEVLGQCQFMKAQQQDHTTTEMNEEVSRELAERRQQLVTPTLKLIVALLCSYDGKNDLVLIKVRCTRHNIYQKKKKCFDSLSPLLDRRLGKKTAICSGTYTQIR